MDATRARSRDLCARRGCCSSRGRRVTWIDSPNFVVIGDVSARTWRSVAIEFEGFRETLTRVMTERATSTPVPTIVIVFPSDCAFTPFKPLHQGKPVPSAGLFVGRQDANYIAVVPEGDVDRMRIVFLDVRAPRNLERAAARAGVARTELAEYYRRRSSSAAVAKRCLGG